MKLLQIGDARITSLIEREGPWRKPEEFFPLYERETGMRHLAEMPAFVFDHASGRMCFTYQTFVIRTPHHTILVDTCLGDHKGFAAPMDFPKQRWLDEFNASGLRFEDIDYVMCTHLHVDHTGWNTRLIDGRWVPTFPRAKYIFHKREYSAWEEVARQGKEHRDGTFRMNCLPVMEAGQALLVDDDFSIDDLITLTPTPGHAASLLRQHRQPRQARLRHRRSVAPPAAVPRAGMVLLRRLGPRAVRAVPPALSRVRRRHRYRDPAGAFSRPHRRLDHQRRRHAVALQIPR
jgi:hypothetical protein